MTPDTQKAEVPRFVYERLRNLDAISFRKVMCALFDRAFYFNMPVNLDGEETAIYEAYMRYFPRLAPPLAKEMPEPPQIAAKLGKAAITCQIETAQIRYFLEDRHTPLPADLEEWQVYERDAEEPEIQIEYGQTLHAVTVRNGLASATVTHEVTEDDVKED